MTTQTVVIGYGAVGRATVERLTAEGRPVLVAQRNAPASLPNGVPFERCNILDAGSVGAIFRKGAQVVVAIGFAYRGAVWRDVWPRAMRNIVDAAAETKARVVFVDNLYMYGPQAAPLREDMPLTSYGVKPKVRADITRIWLEAARTRGIKFAALRAPDFYGPGVRLSHLGDVGFAALAKGRSARLIAPPDTPHDFAYVPDIARAALSLLDAEDDAFGRAWHVPCASTKTPREILALGAQALGVRLKISALPLAILPALGLVVPFAREMSEMRFQWSWPYKVDWSRFGARFWSDPTPFEVGAPATALSFRD
ncbi:MAG: NAD-dependent epimerase/dehydratase family protein [Alphaproteobacteria bacterium]